LLRLGEHEEETDTVRARVCVCVCERERGEGTGEAEAVEGRGTTGQPRPRRTGARSQKERRGEQVTKGGARTCVTGPLSSGETCWVDLPGRRGGVEVEGGGVGYGG